eukprot:3292309-Rhodomonas_salina.1
MVARFAERGVPAMRKVSTTHCVRQIRDRKLHRIRWKYRAPHRIREVSTIQRVLDAPDTLHASAEHRIPDPGCQHRTPRLADALAQCRTAGATEPRGVSTAQYVAIV